MSLDTERRVEEVKDWTREQLNEWLQAQGYSINEPVEPVEAIKVQEDL